MLDLIELQQRAGHETGVFAMTHPHNEPSPFAPHYPPHVEYDPMPDGILDRVHAGALMFWNHKAAKGLAAVIEEFRPDVATCKTCTTSSHHRSFAPFGGAACRR